MILKISKFTIRVEEETLKKFRYVAEYNARSANRELEVLIKGILPNLKKNTERLSLSPTIK